MTENRNNTVKINKLIALASTQSVIITDLISAVLKLQAEIQRRDNSIFSTFAPRDSFMDELRVMSEQLDALVEIASDDD
ncbi:MAG: hypothetical protein ABF636_11430 [Acetobacter sp.]|jgi:hypothetical protein|uniref:Uncharacterized protein n=1 Tax=Acetobacter lovaniensis TaxID=104100 RepID=A0A841QHB4_9PROT|nr:hypothetical protein [Acetobacter lovaniensis]MBB6457427.1 hypothetical protein [Acetobacter lovaniensis]MCP1240380.1 hypothetical protein [Acetobacter lovaniensis]NHN81725.1 hypothetical protein [Acetobacter lovaniensis]GBQ70783.1 hypothetical protein AA0474_2273 [Acetobacter lovaniensis NRIC 0474]